MGSNEDGRNYADIKLSVNLIDASRRQLFFLKEVNKYPDLYHGPLVREAIRRCVDDADGQQTSVCQLRINHLLPENICHCFKFVTSRH